MEYRKGAVIYRTYEQGGVVRAEIDDVKHDASEAIRRMMLNSDIKMIDTDLLYASDAAELDYSYYGKARVHSEDEFDITEGENISRAKALEKYHRAYDKKILAFLKDARSLVATIEHYCEKKGIDTSSVLSVDGLKAARFNTSNLKY